MPRFIKSNLQAQRDRLGDTAQVSRQHGLGGFSSACSSPVAAPAQKASNAGSFRMRQGTWTTCCSRTAQAGMGGVMASLGSEGSPCELFAKLAPLLVQTDFRLRLLDEGDVGCTGKRAVA